MSSQTIKRNVVFLSTVLSALLAANPALATEAGLRLFSAPTRSSSEKPIQIVLYYPTQDSSKPVPMGPFIQRVAINGKPHAKVKGLIVLSHGTGSSEMGFSSLAEALAKNGYLVAGVQHLGDNWQDQSLLRTPGRYFSERPRQASQVIDILLSDPEWQPRIASDAKGPRIGALGHSAGGYTVLALAGGKPDRSRSISHCETDSDDPVYCGMTRLGSTSGLQEKYSDVLSDSRVRAVAALAPAGVMFSASSLATIKIPTTIYAGEKDTFLVPRYHAQWVKQNIPQADYHLVPNAGHYAFMDTPSVPIPSADGDVGANPEGFDRAAFLRQLATDLNQFFDRALQ